MFPISCVILLKNKVIPRIINLFLTKNNPNIDVVLMDIKMPIMNAFEALEKIKSFRPKLVVIAQTADSSSEDEDKIYKAGFYGYLTKPINR